jgi:hypothetical protein
VAALAIVGFGAPMLAKAADHLDAPGKFQSPKGRHDADINDVYAFPAGNDDTVLAMTTHPALGVVTTQTAYATDVLYKINVADAKNKVESFVLKFGAMRKDGTQKYTVTLNKDGRNKQLGSGVTGQNVSLGGDQKVFAGPRSWRCVASRRRRPSLEAVWAACSSRSSWRERWPEPRSAARSTEVISSSSSSSGWRRSSVPAIASRWQP